MDEIKYELDWSGQRPDVEFEDSGSRITVPFDPERIDVVTRNPTVALLLSRVKRGQLDLAPDFQRYAGIWNDVNQSKLIESLLLRIPLPTFYAAEGVDGDDDYWSVVDGIQRLTAISRFMIPDAVALEPLRLKGLGYLGQLNGLRFDELPNRLKTRLEETEVVLHLIRKTTPEEVKFNIFARINTGGMPLSAQELRHALIPGRGRELLAQLAEAPSFLNATSRSVGTSRMADREMVLRFIAFYLSDPSEYRSQDFDGFLRDAMRVVNGLPESRVEQVRDAFSAAMVAARSIFDKHAFRKQKSGTDWRHPINKALFETVAVNLATRSPEQVEELVRRRAEVNQAMIELMADPDFDRAVSVSTGDVAKVRLRFARVDDVLSEFEGIA
ncbi:DUF262 domain-containing protein [Actinosynnema pretiosum subsp. pretiosum]|uniref:DUF262 domain-containing protein n=1 Tax=Actinosynnema pretiosum subsp. pretiosum TaxID=103721 RepID=A0AA45LBP9_9PSEU|nr:hypothetical protein APASM_0923 [Actinosynnema pretiosum subsp. pretiosum]QUF07344.1 DUF262 domain-containing protein [Actinosynnema pretiosum subsp. pretiosum]